MGSAFLKIMWCVVVSKVINARASAETEPVPSRAEGSSPLNAQHVLINIDSDADYIWAGVAFDVAEFCNFLMDEPASACLA